MHPKNQGVPQSPSLKEKRGNPAFSGKGGELLQSFLDVNSTTMVEKRRKEETFQQEQDEQDLIKFLSEDMGHTTLQKNLLGAKLPQVPGGLSSVQDAMKLFIRPTPKEKQSQPKSTVSFAVGVDVNKRRR